jgi:hypothetical protein
LFSGNAETFDVREQYSPDYSFGHTVIGRDGICLYFC